MTCQSVVVVERDTLIRETLMEILADSGYIVYCARNVVEAEKILAQVSEPCLVLADLLSIGMYGPDFTRILRKEDVLIQIPVAIMSSVGVEPDEMELMQMRGADAYLKKPFDLDLFLQTVERYCKTL